MLARRMPFDFYWFLMYYHSSTDSCFKIISGKDAAEASENFYNDMEELVEDGKDKCAVIVTCSVRKEYLEENFDYYTEDFKLVNKKYLPLHKSIQEEEARDSKEKCWDSDKNNISLSANLPEIPKIVETSKIDVLEWAEKYLEHTPMAEDRSSNRNRVIVDQEHTMTLRKRKICYSMAEEDSTNEETLLCSADVSNNTPKILLENTSTTRNLKSETSNSNTLVEPKSTQIRLNSNSESENIQPQLDSILETAPVLLDVSNSRKPKIKSVAKKVKVETSNIRFSTSIKRRLLSESERENIPPKVAAVEENTIKLEAAEPSNKTPEPTSSNHVYIGPNHSPVPTNLYDKVNFKDYKVATRKLLMVMFTREILATHSMSGKASPAFADKKPKPKLDPMKIEDIICTVVNKCDVDPSLVRSQITSKCADENKMYRNRLSKRKN